ncbi:MAG TPA: hypothetical protein VNW04_03375 [Puia sp.]|nr:hypothetical protein [Puia sp.]
MKAIVKLPVFILALLPFLTRCTNASSHSIPTPPASSSAKKKKPPMKSDSLPPEPQVTHLAAGDIKARIARVVCYSYLDIEDYEEDTFTRAPSFQMMPGFSRYGWKYDPHPKVVLTKKQTRKLLAIIGSPKTYKPVQSNCYSPRNCFCFYNSKKEIIGYYQVCFENGRLISVPHFTGSESGTFTESGVKRLRSFCRSAGITAR